MTILFGHPTGKPNSFQAALAHHEAGVLECFCISWMPWSAVMRVLRRIQPLQSQGQRLGRRQFLPLAHVPKIRCRYGESCRLFMRACGFEARYLSDSVNSWSMRTLARECRRWRR
jgi:hypothetical protein